MPYELTIEPLGATVRIEEGQTILDAALRAGVYLPHACGHGLCATCKVRVKAGGVDHGEASSFALMDFERDEGVTLACCATVEDDITIEADIDEDPDAEVIQIQDFVGKVVEAVQLTPTIKGIKIDLGSPLHFQAGQYINVHLPNGIGSRAFSVASSPADGQVIELNVKIIPGGAGTTYLHDNLVVGDTVQITGPYGRFFVRKSAQVPMIFMAGGSGLSSPRAMILDLLQQGCDLPITLVYGQRTREELYCHDAFLELARRHANFTYLPVLSHEPEESGWEGERGFVHEAAQMHFNSDFRGHKAYLCGPPLMIEACIATLMQGRLFERDIYTEKFISAADAQQVRSPLFKSI